MSVTMKLMACGLCLVLFAGALFAQADANKGQVSGTIFDPHQSVVPNARIRLKNTNTGSTREVLSEGEGQFRAGLLDPGSYDVIVEASGFASTVFNSVTVNVGSVVDLQVILELGTETQTVEVA